MHVEGMANIRVCANNIQATLQVAVSSELKETMLISCNDLRKLRVIPAEFPNAVLTVKSSNLLASLKTKLLRKFDKTLCDELNPEPMRCSPMSVALQDDAIPICVTTARSVPKHYEPESKKTIEELIEQQVIEESEPEPEPDKPIQEGRTQRRDNSNSVGTADISARSNRGQLGRRNIRGARYQHVGQRGGVSQHDRFPANSLHRLLPEDWGQGK